MKHKILVNFSDESAYAGAAIYEAPTGQLVALAFSPHETIMTVHLIDLTPKQRTLLRQLKLRA